MIGRSRDEDGVSAAPDDPDGWRPLRRVRRLDVAPTQYVALELQFEKAGNVPLDVMAVLPQGIYEGLGPIATTF